MKFSDLNLGHITENQLIGLFDSPCTYTRALELLQAFYIQERLSKGQREKIKIYIRDEAILSPLRIKWSEKSTEKTIVTTNKSPNPFQIGAALYSEGYFSYEASLACQGLLAEIPKTLHLSKERPRYGSKNEFNISDKSLQNEFVKPARTSNRWAIFRETKFVFTERESVNNLGVVTQEPSETFQIPIKFTDLERTLIDMTVSPHYAGGIKNVIELWKSSIQKAKINVEKLQRTYTALEYRYPYWQRIGYILRELDARASGEWREFFGKPKNKFFLDRQFLPNWKFDSEWRLYYPT